MQEARISFRAGAPIAEALAQCAERAGCSLSEYLRSIVREHVGLSEAPQDAPASVHQLASNGDPAAYSQIASWHYQRGCDGTEPPIIAFARASDYARLAAMARGTRQDWLSFLFLLDQHSNALRNAGLGNLADIAAGESVALAEYMAEGGDEEMADLIASNARNLSPEALTLARDLREHVKGQVTC